MANAKNNNNSSSNFEENVVIMQNTDFNYAQESDLLANHCKSTGAIVTFCGLVRDFYVKDTPTNISGEVQAIYLECYEKMAIKVIGNIIKQAESKFNIITAKVIHKVGLLHAGEKIVFIGVTANHRKDAFCACEYIIDFLKVEAPFWKKEITPNDAKWLEQKASDRKKASLHKN